MAVAAWAALACFKALQAELSSSWMAACCSGLSCAMHSVHSPPEVWGGGKREAIRQAQQSQLYGPDDAMVPPLAGKGAHLLGNWLLLQG